MRKAQLSVFYATICQDTHLLTNLLRASDPLEKWRFTLRIPHTIHITVAPFSDPDVPARRTVATTHSAFIFFHLTVWGAGVGSDGLRALRVAMRARIIVPWSSSGVTKFATTRSVPHLCVQLGSWFRTLIIPRIPFSPLNTLVRSVVTIAEVGGVNASQKVNILDVSSELQNRGREWIMDNVCHLDSQRVGSRRVEFQLRFLYNQYFFAVLHGVILHSYLSLFFFVFPFSL